MTTLSGPKRRILERLKRTDGMTAPEIAAAFELTQAGVRQHLTQLEASGLVARGSAPPEGRGRPPEVWNLTALADEQFPDHHADLTVELIRAVRVAVGKEGLDKVIAERTKAQLVSYREDIAPHQDFDSRVEALARRRTAEGYLAECKTDDGPGILLIENHCPICDAAAVCTGICESELELFQAALGPDAVVTREQHLLSGDRRCVYRVKPAG